MVAAMARALGTLGREIAVGKTRAPMTGKKPCLATRGSTRRRSPGSGQPLNRVWYPALKRAGIGERKPYQKRHTFATLALSAGGHRLGVQADGAPQHQMIIEHSYRFIPNLTRQDGSAFDQAAAQFGL